MQTRRPTEARDTSLEIAQSLRVCEQMARRATAVSGRRSQAWSAALSTQEIATSTSSIKLHRSLGVWAAQRLDLTNVRFKCDMATGLI
jgi:hypothetical protein